MANHQPKNFILCWTHPTAHFNYHEYTRTTEIEAINNAKLIMGIDHKAGLVGYEYYITEVEK